MMSIGRYARVLVAALAIGGAVLGLGTGQAEAAKIKHPPDNGVRCWLYQVDEDHPHGGWEAYEPGDVVEYDPGHKIVCGSDGEWHDVRTDGSGGTNNGVGHQGAYGTP